MRYEAARRWVAALTRLIDDAARRAELRARGWARAAEFNWERAARETLAVYRKAERFYRGWV
ncbi:MAG: hypothetical protein ACKV2U_00875 [Bryobacteraceae bacterium]